MQKKCPICGCEYPESENTCIRCGVELNEVEEFEYDFGDKPPVSEPVVSDEWQNANTFAGKTAYVPIVATTIDSVKANKYKKEIFYWSIFILFACTFGLILNLASLGDTRDIQEMLPYIREEYYGIFKTVVDVYYAGIVLLVLMVVASVVLIVFGAKLNKFNFPVQNDNVFSVSRNVFYASLVVVVLEFILCIVEVVAVVCGMRLEAMFEGTDMNMTMNVIYLIKDFIVLGGTAVMTAYALKLSKSKKI